MDYRKRLIEIDHEVDRITNEPVLTSNEGLVNLERLLTLCYEAMTIEKRLTYNNAIGMDDLEMHF